MVNDNDGLLFVKVVRPLIFIFVAGISVLLMLFVKFTVPSQQKAVPEEPDYQVLKLVDIQEYEPPRVSVPVQSVAVQPKVSESVQESAVPVREDQPAAGAADDVPGEPDYVPQHKISVIPQIPSREILSRITYPPMALKQGIEGVVYLELFIDDHGRIRKVTILKDPGYGFAEAAVAAVNGLVCSPALVNGKPVAVRFRYPVRFTLH
jgi:periplasmic protein TonB